MRISPGSPLAVLLPAVLVIVLALLAGAQRRTDAFRVCEGIGERTLTDRRVMLRSSQPDVIYNSVRNEYFLVYLSEEIPDQTAIHGQRFSESGVAIGGPIMIWSYDDDNGELGTERKEFPIVAYNSKDDYYMVVWEYDYEGDGSDFDIAGRAVNGDGSMDQTALLVSYTGGRDSAPHMAYSPVDNAFVLAHEVDGDERGMAIVKLNSTHQIGESLLLGTDNMDREPFVTYHPPSNRFYVVWEWDLMADGKTDIGAVIVSGTPLRLDSQGIRTVGSTVESNDGSVLALHDHDARLTYSSKDDQFLLTWEVDGSNDRKYVVSQLLNNVTAPQHQFQVLGHRDSFYDRHPAAAYVNHTNSYLVVFESGSSDNTTRVEGVELTAHSLEIGHRFQVNSLFNNEHWPVLAVSENCTTAFAVWRSGNNWISPGHSGQAGSTDDDYYGWKRRTESGQAPVSATSASSLHLLAVSKVIPSDHQGHKSLLPIEGHPKQRRAAAKTASKSTTSEAVMSKRQNEATPATIQMALICLPHQGVGCALAVASDGGSGGGQTSGMFTMTNLMIGFGVLVVVTLIVGAIGFLVWYKFRGKQRPGGWQPVKEIDTSFATFQADNFVGDDDM